MTEALLIVDDEAEIREGVCLRLQLAGFTTRTANNGEECLAAVAVQHPPLIILDLLMPKMDGFQTLRCLRENPTTADIPVIMFSANLRDEQKALEAGASYFVQKPYDGRQLIETIHCTLNQRPAPVSA